MATPGSGGRALVRASLLGVVIAVVLYAANESPVASGTTPLLHLTRLHEFSLDRMPDLKNKTAVVTGASSGLGLGVARGLAGAGATVVVTTRSAAKCAATLRAVEGDVKCVVMELLSLRSVYKAAQQMSSISQKGIDLCVLNAGIMASPFALSEDGLEAQFQTNHLGHFALIRALLPALRTARARVVFVSSVAHYLAPAAEELWTAERLNDKKRYDRWGWYGWSKLCNALTARELSRREAASGVVAHAVHPGAVRGNLLRFSRLPRVLVRLMERLFYWDPETAALTVLRPLVEPFDAGTYFVPIARPWPSSARAADRELAARLWAASEVLVNDIRTANGNFSTVYGNFSSGMS